MSRLTFENRRDYPTRRDQFFFISVEIIKIETFQSRFRCVKIFIEIVETNRDFQDKLRFLRYLKVIEIFEINRDFFSLHRDILDFRHLWKVVGEGFTLTFLSLPWVTF